MKQQMSEFKIDRLVSMANQIALNLQACGSEEQVAVMVAEHLEKFWSPPMKKLIVDQLAESDTGLTSIARLAVSKLERIQREKQAAR